MAQSQPQPPTGKESKVFKDPIHGPMEFHPYLVKIIDTPQFQRLRHLKQLGAAYLVYPGASHTRFEHSLGVAHLAGKLVRSLQEKQPELEIDDRDVLCVEIAGLCHDLGHGPFSHMFDQVFIPKTQTGTKWEHEKGSVDMFDYIVDEYHFDKLMADELNLSDEEGSDRVFIKEMIIGPNKEGQYKGRPRKKSFLYEIVANKRTGIDVDKLDYLTRDFYHLGIKNYFDHRRFIQFARVCEADGQKHICTRDKELSDIYEVYHTRHSVHRKACQHKTLKIIDLMITEALLKADEKLRISEQIHDMKKYTELTDRIFEKILYSSDDGLKEAREILQKIITRKLYKYLGKTKMKHTLEDIEKLKEQWKVELANMPTFQNEPNLTKDDFEIIITTFDFGMKEKNPIENCYFYHKSDSTKAFKIPTEQVSRFLLPMTFSEKWISVYCRSSDENTQVIAYRHFYEWCRHRGFLLPPNPPRPGAKSRPKVDQGSSSEVDLAERSGVQQRKQSGATQTGLKKETAEKQASKGKVKVFNDPVHGHMEFSPRLVQVIDSPQFQRLRFIKQLGGVYYVYPGASHNRFEHSLGVAHLAGELVRSLQRKQPELGIDQKDVLCVEIAGLCHDLGHGPFSEVFDELFLQKVKWERSTASAILFKQIDADIGLSERDKIFIEEMIKGIDPAKETPRGRPKKSFLYDIVNNKRNGVDVNVFDSVARDCYQLGLKTNFDHRHFIKFAKVFTVEGKSQICIRGKLVSNMYDLFHTIASLHTLAYQHRVTLNIHLMMSDVVGKQKNEMTDKQALEKYSTLTDSRFADLFGERSAEEVIVAQNIVERIHFRCLYKYVHIFDKDQETQETCSIDQLAQKIASELGVQKEDIGIYVSTTFPQNCSTKTIHGMNFYDKSGRIITGKEIAEKRPQISKPEITHKQWIYVFFKKETSIDLADAEKKVEKILAEMLKTRKVESKIVHTSCVKFMSSYFM